MKICYRNSFWTLIATKAVQEVTGFTFLFYVTSVYTKKSEIINYDRTIGTNRIKLIFQKILPKMQGRPWETFINSESSSHSTMALQMKVEVVNFRKSQVILWLWFDCFITKFRNKWRGELIDPPLGRIGLRVCVLIADSTYFQKSIKINTNFAVKFQRNSCSWKLDCSKFSVYFKFRVLD